VGSRELDGAAEAAAIDPLVMLDAGFDLHTVDVEALRVLDLREAAALRHVGLDTGGRHGAPFTRERHIPVR